MNSLRVKKKTKCGTCGVILQRTKTIKVDATTELEAKNEARLKVERWVISLDGLNCRVCRSIIDKAI